MPLPLYCLLGAGIIFVFVGIPLMRKAFSPEAQEAERLREIEKARAELPKALDRLVRTSHCIDKLNASREIYRMRWILGPEADGAREEARKAISACFPDNFWIEIKMDGLLLDRFINFVRKEGATGTFSLDL